MRHNPDILFLGETRNAFCAKSLINAALSGHMVMTTIHAGNGIETIERLLDFGISLQDLKSTLLAIVSQRLYQGKNGKKVCVYGILEAKDLD